MKYTTFPAALLAGLTGSVAAMLLTAPAAGAATNPHQGIYQAAADVGYRVSNEHDECTASPGLMGFVTSRGGKPVEFVICTGNAPSSSTAFKTIRHEGIHVAQVCKGGMILPQHEVEFISRAQDEGWDILAYPERQWSTEAEALVLANEYTAQEVEATIRHFCF